jgi:hypothetical protein
MNRLLTATLVFLLLAVPVRLFAKGETTKITIQGFHLKAPIEIVNPLILSKFNVWAGPGTWSSEPGFNVNAPSFIVDWSSGPVSDVPDTQASFKVSFYTRTPNEQLVYVIYYTYDPSARRGYVYLPSREDQFFAVNAGTIYRGVEGQWFRSWSVWDEIVAPLIKNAQMPHNLSEPGVDPGEPGVIEGTVVDSSGQPIRNARVWAEESRIAQIEQVPPLRYVVADQNGQFRIVHLRPGDYDIFAVSSDSFSMLPLSKQSVHLSRYKPVGTVIIRIDPASNMS